MTPDKNSQIIIYQTEDGQTKNDGRTLSGCQISISEHVKHIVTEGELDKKATVRNFRTVQIEGSRSVNRNLDFYNLDMIISVGYRVQSHVATRFRQWATKYIREFIVKDFVLDDERLKKPDLPFDFF
jgi:hypothetical protein